MIKAYIIKLNHVRVSDSLKDSDFPVYPLKVCLVLDLILLQNLDCNLYSN